MTGSPPQAFVLGRQQFRKKLIKLKWQNIRTGYHDFSIFFTMCACFLSFRKQIYGLDRTILLSLKTV